MFAVVFQDTQQQDQEEKNMQPTYETGFTFPSFLLIEKITSPVTYRAKTSQGGTRGCFINRMTSSLLNWLRGSFCCQTRGSLARVRDPTWESQPN